MTMIYFIYVGNSMPHEDKFTTRVELINETMLLLVFYSFVLFTKHVEDPILKYKIGFITINIVLVQIAINYLIIIGTTVAAIIKKCKLRCMKRK